MFLSFTNFYRRFIADYFYVITLLMNCLHEIMKKKRKKLIKLILNKKTQDVFEHFKQFFLDALLLAHFNSQTEICLKTDALTVMIAEILTQRLSVNTLNAD